MQLSIIIPTFNRKQKLQKLIKSIFVNEKKLLKNVEVIIINDGSTDNTSNFISQLNFKNLRAYNIQNSGRSYALLKGILYAKGKFTIFMDDDDFFYKNSIKTIKEDIEFNQNINCFIYNVKLKKKRNLNISQNKVFRSYFHFRSKYFIFRDLKEVIETKFLKQVVKKILFQSLKTRIPTGYIFAKLSKEFSLKWIFKDKKIIKINYLSDGISNNLQILNKADLKYVISFYQLLLHEKNINFFYKFYCFINLIKYKIRLNYKKIAKFY